MVGVIFVSDRLKRTLDILIVFILPIAYQIKNHD